MAEVIQLLVILFTLQVCRSVKSLDPMSDTSLVHSAVLDVDENFHLFWDFDDENIVFEVRVNTLGFFGLGFSPNGGMEDSDIVIGGVYNDGRGPNDIYEPYLTDRHAIGMSEPILDKTQDWKIVSSSQNNSHTTVRFWRKLKTCDHEDREFKSETVRVIWAYHPEDWEDAGSRYHGTQNRGSKSIFLLNPQKIVPDLPEDIFSIDFLNSNVSVPDADTTYWCEVFSFTPLQRKHHVIKFEPIIQTGNEGIVHHIVLFACTGATMADDVGQPGSCHEQMPEAIRDCTISIFAWAVGGRPFYLPEHVGYPFGLDDDPKFILLQTHFDNPQRRSDFMDSSGIRFTFTPTLRENDAATLVTGVISWNNLMIPPFEESFQIDGHCVPDCTDQGMGNETEIHIFATFLHAHLLSNAIKFRHVRNGVEQRPISVDENYDFNFQETRVVEPEARVQRGDHLITECFYNTMHKKKVTFGGEGTYEEMCATFAMYYPRVPLRNCYSMVKLEQLAKAADVQIYRSSGPYNWTVSEPEYLRGQNLFDVLVNETDWSNEQTRARAQQIATSYDDPMTQLCEKDTASFRTNIKSSTPPRIVTEWREDPTCVVAGANSLHDVTTMTQLVFAGTVLMIYQLFLF